MASLDSTADQAARARAFMIMLSDGLALPRAALERVECTGSDSLPSVFAVSVVRWIMGIVR